MEDNQITGLIAAISALIGGAGLKVVERFFRHRERRQDDMIVFRKEILDECKRLRGELAEWHAKYYALMDQYIDLEKRQAILEMEMQSLRNQLGALKHEGC